MPKIKLHHPTGDVLAETIRRQLVPRPGDIVVVFDPASIFVSNITILSQIDNSNPAMPFMAPIDEDGDIFRWTYAYKVPEGYASVEASND